MQGSLVVFFLSFPYVSKYSYLKLGHFNERFWLKGFFGEWWQVKVTDVPLALLFGQR